MEWDCAFCAAFRFFLIRSGSFPLTHFLRWPFWAWQTPSVCAILSERRSSRSERDYSLSWHNWIFSKCFHFWRSCNKLKKLIFGWYQSWKDTWLKITFLTIDYNQTWKLYVQKTGRLHFSIVTIRYNFENSYVRPC